MKCSVVGCTAEADETRRLNKKPVCRSCFNESDAMNYGKTAIVETLLPGTAEKIKNQICPTCSKDIQGEFRDELSKKEYKISGMCQDCQDKVFGA